MSEIVRFGVSLERELLQRFDWLIRGKRYTNRSEALRDLIRKELVKRAWKEDREVAGAITFVYDHHRRELLNRLTDLQHDHQGVIISTQHIRPLSGDRGRARTGEGHPESGRCPEGC